MDAHYKLTYVTDAHYNVFGCLLSSLCWCGWCDLEWELSNLEWLSRILTISCWVLVIKNIVWHKWLPSVLWHCWSDGRKGIRPVKKWGDGGGGHWLVRMEWRPAGWSVCLPLLIFRCTIKSRSSLLAPAHPGGPGKRAVKRMWCGGVVYSTSVDYLGAWFVVEIYVELLFIICFQCNDEIIVSFCGLSLLMPCCCPDLSTVYIGYNWLIADTMLLLYLTAHNCLLVMMSILSIVHLYSCLLTWYIQGGGKKHMPLSTVSQKVGRYSTVCELQSKIWLHITVNLLLSVVVKES